jgi:hypothetical protein
LPESGAQLMLPFPHVIERPAAAVALRVCWHSLQCAIVCDDRWFVLGINVLCKSRHVFHVSQSRMGRRRRRNFCRTSGPTAFRDLRVSGA